MDSNMVATKKYFVSFTLIVQLMLCNIVYADMMQAHDTYQPRYIEVSGESESKINPDFVAIHLAISKTEKNVNLAKNAVNQSVNQLFAIAKEFNIAKIDQIAEQIQRYPSYQWKINKRQYLGETIRRTITFKIRDFEQYSRLIDKISSVNNVQITSTQPRLNNHKKVQNANLQQALKNARSKAQAMLSAYNQRIDQVLSINEGVTHDNQPRPYMMRQMSAGMTTDNEMAEFIFEPIKVKSKVRVKFSIK